MTDQLRSDGSLRHLLTLEGLSRAQIEGLLERSQGFVRPLGAKPPVSQALAGATVANLFTEPSTRTRVSFELAAKRLGAQVVNLEVQLSSRVRARACWTRCTPCSPCTWTRSVIPATPKRACRDSWPRTWLPRERAVRGEAHVSHPTQGLLDALTVYQRKQRFEGLAVAMVGDIRHSRSRAPAWHALRTLGVADLRIVAPPALIRSATNSQALRATRNSQPDSRARTLVMMSAHPEGAHGPGGPAARRRVLRGLGADARAPGPGAPTPS